jgi:tRNA(Ile)-lysidine synthase
VADHGPAYGIRPIVGHVDHGIHPASAQVATLVRGHADRLGLQYLSERLELGAATSETVARRARYAALHHMARQAGARGILTAHHANDQVETVLMHVLRGSGPAGLAGMDVMTPEGVVRLLLRFPLAFLASVVAEEGLAVWQDPANSDPVHLRSWLRVEALPLLRERLPDVYSKLLEVAHQARDQREAWEDLIDRLPGLDLRHEATLSATVFPWFADDSPLARQLLAAVGRRAGIRLSQRAIQRALGLVRGGVSGRRADVGGGWGVELSFGRLVFSRQQEMELGREELRGDLGRMIWNGWEIRWRRGTAGATARRAFVTWISPGLLEIGPAEPGDRIQPLGFSGHRPLARLFQDAKVPVSERRTWPVLRRDGEVLWVPGVCRAALDVPAENREAVEVQVSARPSVAVPSGPA